MSLLTQFNYTIKFLKHKSFFVFVIKTFAEIDEKKSEQIALKNN